MTVLYAPSGRLQIAYEPVGPQDGEPLLLVVGLGMQMLGWPDLFCADLAARGFAVTRFDNRDVGLSTHLHAAGTPTLPQLLLSPGAVAAYSLADMADDAVAVLDARGWDSAHVVGASLGGMIAQTVATRHPDRVRTLTSIMSTPSTRIGRGSPRALLALATPPARTREESAERSVRVFRVIGSPGYPLDEAWLRDLGARSFDRAHDPAGAARQLAAVRAAPDRRPALRGVRVPTLVLHGEDDPLVTVAGGRATAAAVPGARLVTYPGMGHNLPRELWPAVLGEIAAVAARAR